MFKKIKNIFTSNTTGEAIENQDILNDKNMAIAVLLIEAAHMDGDFTDEEQKAIQKILINFMELTPFDADQMIVDATIIKSKSNQILPYTKAIKKHYGDEGKFRVIEMLWEVVYSDGVLHAFEDNLMRRVGALIYVPDRERGIAKKRVIKKLGLNQ
jgi:uncharacterized tellurite resistance protein B-like protein